LSDPRLAETPGRRLFSAAPRRADFAFKSLPERRASLPLQLARLPPMPRAIAYVPLESL
jgi:hypothetical protein